MSSIKPTTLAVVLVNLGTPSAPTPKAVGEFLAEFLADTRVVSINKALWWLILNGLVIPLRAKRVAHAYQSIWVGDSPMRVTLAEQATKLEQLLAAFLDDQLGLHAAHPLRIIVRPAMTYGMPSIDSTLNLLKQEGVEHIIAIPMFPQFSATTTGAVYDAFAKAFAKRNDLPAFSIIKDYHQQPLYIQALAQSIEQHWQKFGKAGKLLFSFHGIPKVNEQRGDPYPTQCRITAARVAQALGLSDNQWSVSFQSRFGKQEWVKPYTDDQLVEWAEQGVRSVQVISPAFTADCLETLEEIAIESKEAFMEAAQKTAKDMAGTLRFEYIPALNTHDTFIALLASLAWPMVRSFVETLPLDLDLK